jgi:hypothetical protein
MTTIKLRHLALLLVLLAGLPMAKRSDMPLHLFPVEVVTGPRSHCGLRSPMQIQVRAAATPLVGQELPLEIKGMNASDAARCDLSVASPPGSLEPLDGPPAWHEELARGQTFTRTRRFRVVSREPIHVTATIATRAPDLVGKPPGEHSIVLYPFEVVDGEVRIGWDPVTFQPLSAPKRPIIKLADGDIAIVYTVP